MKLQSLWSEIVSNKKNVKSFCRNCPLCLEKWEGAHWDPLILRNQNIDDVKIMVVTEGPNRKWDEPNLVSSANHPTFTLINSLFNGNFKPMGNDANSYWTHVRKCFIDGMKKYERAARKLCSSYLFEEFKLVVPELVITFGKSAFSQFYTEEKHAKLVDLFLAQENEFYAYKHDDFESRIILVPHPSGLNRFWNKPPPRTREILEFISQTIHEVLQIKH